MYLLLILRFSTFSSILDLRHLSSFLLKKPKKKTLLQRYKHTYILVCTYIHSTHYVLFEDVGRLVQSETAIIHAKVVERYI